ncbi:hypothetical protein BDV93DRAFT_473191 [Ceratobasidium sp. AG-I]|nr:hypothetical protein BDV93DRAFT_473191 [Ceratobasidium sp. AG-I]
MTELTRQVPDDIFRPPAGGDIILRSNDGVEFLVHSVILGVASSVFEGLLCVGAKKDTVELSENAETLSLVLRFIYPNTKIPTITSFDALSLCLHAAQKYDLEGMLENIDDQLATKAIPQSLLHQDPLRVCEFALQFNLPDTRALATPLVITGEIDFSDPLQLSGLVKSHSPITVTRLASIQGIRGKMLADVLLRFYNAPIAPGSNRRHMFHTLSCAPCQKWLDECDKVDDRRGLRTENPPSWVLAWADLVYQTLLHAPLEKSDELFDWTILEKLKGESRVCQRCLNDFWRYHSQQELFNEWAKGIKNVLTERLNGLQYLYGCRI